ncbi:transposase [Amycolatopsis lexingtonensis]|uniref:Transposase n=1 Tax=Amycolatopsis lexingtonensis TaxID=218822 RepID=A0ABR9IF29_9PSEU|nr:transposase [Amycolatopsis lexingtonensis]MBE1495656.1 transposase [Amycolatopsis lexingtonensis]MBE1501774.1 transposase [Amycolatopsis lexingtonensis]
MDELDQIIERVAGVDLGKAGLVACVRVPSDRPGRRQQEVRSYDTFSRSLLELADWLRAERVTLVAMEATSSYWKPVFYLLEAEGFDCWLLNPKHVKHLPGRPKTDTLDAVWLAKVVERGMCRPSLVHPAPIRQLRDLTRYRRTLIQDRTREKQRLEKLLEDAQIKLSSVISDILGVSGREMLEAMIGGQRNPRVLAQLARTRMRTKIGVLEEALTGHFTDHHAFLTRTMIDRIDRISADVEKVNAAIEEAMAPFRAAAQRLDEITGIGIISAQELIAEIGVDMTRFPSPGHLVSWAKFAPIAHQSAATTGYGSTGKGNPWLAGTLGEVVAGLSRTRTFLGERYRRLVRRRGKKRAITAVGNSVLKIIWHLLSDPGARYQDLGQGYYADRYTTQRRRRTLIRDLERLTGQHVTLRPHAA